MRLLTLLVIVCASPAAPGELRERNFAFGFEIEPDGANAVQTVLLPVDLYRGVVRADLGDVRVFNSQGQVVPHAVRSLATPTTAAAAHAELPFFPVRGATDARNGDLSLHVQRSDAGTIIDVDSEGQAGSEAPGRAVVAYLLDGSAVTGEIRALSLRWAANPFIARVNVAASDDLSAWTSVATGMSIARLEFRGHSLERREVPLSRHRAKYLRITWEGDRVPFELTGATATLWPEEREPPRRRIEVEGVADAAEPNLFHFDTGGPVPIDRVRCNLPERNTLAEVELQSAPTPDGEWSTRYRGLVYRVEFDGQEITNEPIPAGPTTDRHWRLRVDGKGGGLGGGSPSLETAWLPQQLLFVARGDPPFRLAYGSTVAEPSAFDAASLLALVPGQNIDALAAESVDIGEQRTLGGEAALQPPVPATPWKKWILWGLLIGGVVLLGGMTVRLVRQLNPRGSTGSETSDAD